MAEVLEMDFDLNGLYHVKVDAKGRMPLPAQLRNALPENMVDFKVTVSPEGDCLYLFSSEGFNRWSGRRSKIALARPMARACWNASSGRS